MTEDITDFVFTFFMFGGVQAGKSPEGVELIGMHLGLFLLA